MWGIIARIYLMHTVYDFITVMYSLGTLLLVMLELTLYSHLLVGITKFSVKPFGTFKRTSRSLHSDAILDLTTIKQ